MGHIDFGLEGSRAVGKFAFFHPFKQVEIFLDTSAAIGAVFARLGEGASVLAGLLGGQVADIGLAFFDEFYSPIIHLLKIIGSEIETVFPVPSQPADVFNDGIDIFLVFLGGIGVVKTQVAFAAKFLGNAEVQTNTFGMADVEIAVGFRREACMDPSAPGTFGTVFCNDLADKIHPLS